MMKESKQDTNKVDYFSFLQKARSMVGEADKFIEQYVQHFIEQVDEVINNRKSDS